MEVVNTTTTTDPVNMYNNLNKFILNPIVFIILFIIIVSYFLFSSSLGNQTSDNSNTSHNLPKFFIIIIVIIVILLIIVKALQYFFSINVSTYISGLFTPKTTVDVVVNQPTSTPAASVPEMKFKKQVYNIPGNNYNYENAQALCQAYGSELATYNQIEKAYNNGAEWCNYGWSANQMAFFPTQQETYNNLQKIDGHHNDCGRPGINGGYMANPNIKFGVNCYGYKPKITQEENELMDSVSPYPVTMKEIEFQKRVDYWKNKVDEILVSPFNYTNWGAPIL
jgi:hypothetical protein